MSDRFLYFNFRGSNARGDFLALAQRYRDARASNQLKALKFSCAAIDDIYGQHIKGSLKDWLGRPVPDEENIFRDLAEADEAMVRFIDEEFAHAIDSYLGEVEPLVDKDDLDGAEAARLQLKVNCRELSAKLERFSSDLSELVIKFARLAGEPVRR